MNDKAKSGLVLCCLTASILLTGCSDKASGTADPNNITFMSPSTESENASAKDFIDTASAENAALSHAGLSDAETEFTKTELDYENGNAEYEIEFTANGYKYEYDINAIDGSVLKFSKKKILETGTETSAAGITPEVTSKSAETTARPAETAKPSTAQNNPSTTASVNNITAEDAKTAALNHAGLNASEVTFTKTELDYDDGRTEYEIEFYSSSDKYEYDINASTGAVIKYSKKAIRNKNGTNVITADEAKNAALEYTGLTADDVRFIKAELDYDDGTAEYDVEFYYGRTEYEIKINAYTGEIIETEID